MYSIDSEFQVNIVLAYLNYGYVYIHDQHGGTSINNSLIKINIHILHLTFVNRSTP